MKNNPMCYELKDPYKIQVVENNLKRLLEEYEGTDVTEENEDGE